MAGSSLDFGLNPDLAVEQQLAEQRQHVADMLSQRGATPLQIHSGTGSPLQAMGQMFAAYRGKQLRTENEAKLRTNAADYNTRLAEGVQDYMRQRNGTGVAPDPQEVTQSQDYGTPAPAPMRGDPKSAAIMALTSRNPIVAQLGHMDYAHELKREDPFSVAADAVHVIPAANGQPEQRITNPKAPEHAIPQNWTQHIPEGGKASPNAMPGTFAMPGADGQPDIYQMEFERGAYKGAKKLDSSPTVRVTNNNPAPVTITTIADPTDPTGQKTLQVDARTYKGGGMGSPGVVGSGAKLTQTGGVDTKLAVAKPQAELRVNSIVQNMDRLSTAMQTLHDDKGLAQITGSIYGRTPNLTNKATGAQAQLNSIKSQIFQESLQAMREASKTGGAVGNVSDKEGDKLERTLAALDQAQGTPAFQGQLKKAMAQVQLSKQLIQRAFQDQYGHVESYRPGGAGGDKSAPPPPEGYQPL